jgi:hypothetical protein
MAEYGKTIANVVTFFADYQERILRCKTTTEELAKEVVKAKEMDPTGRVRKQDAEVGAMPVNETACLRGVCGQPQPLRCQEM